MFSPYSILCSACHTRRTRARSRSHPSRLWQQLLHNSSCVFHTVRVRASVRVSGGADMYTTAVLSARSAFLIYVSSSVYKSQRSFFLSSHFHSLPASWKGTLSRLKCSFRRYPNHLLTLSALNAEGSWGVRRTYLSLAVLLQPPFLYEL